MSKWLDIGGVVVLTSQVRALIESNPGGWGRCEVWLKSDQRLVGSRAYRDVAADLLGQDTSWISRLRASLGFASPGFAATGTDAVGSRPREAGTGCMSMQPEARCGALHVYATE